VEGPRVDLMDSIDQGAVEQYSDERVWGSVMGTSLCRWNTNTLRPTVALTTLLISCFASRTANRNARCLDGICGVAHEVATTWWSAVRKVWSRAGYGAIDLAAISVELRQRCN